MSKACGWIVVLATVGSILSGCQIFTDLFGNKAPEIVIAAPSTVTVGSEVTIDALSTTDPEGDGLTYYWDLLAIPGDSFLKYYDLDYPNIVFNMGIVTFVPDRDGSYTLELMVSDGSNQVVSTVSVVASWGVGALPAVPTGLAIVDETFGSLSINWDDVVGALGYSLYRDFSSSGSFSTKVRPYEGFSYAADDELSRGTTYWYRVRAWNSNGVSALSSAVSGTTDP